MARAGPQSMLPRLALLGKLWVQLERRWGKLGQSLAEVREALALLAALALSACYLGWQQGLESPQAQRLHLTWQVGWQLGSLRWRPAGVKLGRAQKPEVKLQVRLLEVVSWVGLTRERTPAGKLREQLLVALRTAHWAVQPAVHSITSSCFHRQLVQGFRAQGPSSGLLSCAEMPPSARLANWHGRAPGSRDRLSSQCTSTQHRMPVSMS